MIGTTAYKGIPLKW